MSTRFAYSGAIVTRPDGSQHRRVSASLRDGVMTLVNGGEPESIVVSSAWTEGRRGWVLVDAGGNRWGVKREGGCGCRG